MHSITLSGHLADLLGTLYMRKLASQLAEEVHAPVSLFVTEPSEFHGGGAPWQADPPPAKLVRLVKLGADKWMWQARFGKNSDGEPYNAAGGTVTFTSQDEAKAWLLTEPAGRWRIVL